MNQQDEIYYLNRIAKGETHLFAYFLETYSRSVFSMIFRIVNNREDAEELTQDTFMKVFNKLSSFKGDSCFSTWLYRIAYNTAISASRKKRIVFPTIDESQLNNISDQSVDELLGKHEDERILKLLERAIEQLNIEDKTLICLYHLEEKTVADLAQILNISTDNVKVKLFRARKKLVVLMNNQGYETR